MFARAKGYLLARALRRCKTRAAEWRVKFRGVMADLEVIGVELEE
jgi:hypothetical protein